MVNRSSFKTNQIIINYPIKSKGGGELVGKGLSKKEKGLMHMDNKVSVAAGRGV